MSDDTSRKAVLEQLRALRGRLDPQVLRQLRDAAEGRVPFDRDAAKDVVFRFLEQRQDGGLFASRLADQLKRPPGRDDEA